MRDCVAITDDVFGIAARLKSIDDGYFVVYNLRRGAFEVHNSRQRGSTFSLSVPYPCLDVRTVTLVQKTRVENAKKLLAEMERENRAQEVRRAKDAADKAAADIEREMEEQTRGQQTKGRRSEEV